MATAVIMPRQGQSVESCILVEWLVSPNDKVDAGTVLANIETDKAVFEVEAPEAGTVLELFCDAGDDIPVLANIAAIGEPGEDVSGLRPNGAAPAEAAPAAAPAEAAAEAAPAEATAAPAPAPITGAASTGISPRARKAAAKSGVDAGQLAGTGPGGRVIERDITQAAAGAPRLSPAALAAARSGGLQAPAGGSGPGGMVLANDLQAAGAAAPQAPAIAPAAKVEVPVTGIRKLIADKMHQSLATTAQLTLNRSFNAASLQSFRKRVKAKAEQLGLPNITLNDMIVYATARTLKKYPALNAHYLGDRIVQYGSVNMGVAMDTPRGLMVPVLSGASELTLTAISKGIKPMVDAAQKGSINPDLLSGGTFTITNMGMLNIESFTPILNVPEVAILGVGGINLKPVQGANGVDFIPAINLSLTVNHQAADGADGARFLQDLAAALEDFELTLAE